MATLYIVATPIGNLEDITLRALRVLKEVDFILAEDTRVTKRLLNHYEIKTPVISYPADDRAGKIEKFIEMLKEGKNLALVTDAGTPGISDPGSQLVRGIRRLMTKAGPSSSSDYEGPAFVGEGLDIGIVPIPGPSALTAALSVAGLSKTDFTFFGFLPHKKGRETLFKEIAEMERVVVFYESPHRILKTLEALAKFAPRKKIMISRELTKIYEEFVEGSPEEVLKYFTENEDKVRGEFVVVAH